MDSSLLVGLIVIVLVVGSTLSLMSMQEQLSCVVRSDVLCTPPRKTRPPA
jgi:hypothetical protein